MHLSGQGYTVIVVNRVITLGHIYWREEMRQINRGLEDSFTSQHYVTGPHAALLRQKSQPWMNKVTLLNPLPERAD